MTATDDYATDYELFVHPDDYEFDIIPDCDGGVSVGEYSFSPECEYELQIEYASQYLAALLAAQRYQDGQEDSADKARLAEYEARVMEAAIHLRRCCAGVDSSTGPLSQDGGPLANTAPIPAVFIRMARGILSAIDEGLV